MYGSREPNPEVKVIEVRREAVPISRYELAVRAGLNHTTYVRLCSGETQNPHPRTLNKLRRVLAELEGEAA